MKAVILDLDGVYFVKGTAQFIAAMHHQYHIPITQIEEIYLKSEMMKKYKQGIITGEEFWTYAITAWNINATKEEILHILQGGYLLNTQKDEILKLLHKNRIKKIICTNNFPERIRVLDEKFNFLKEFDYTILSYEHNRLKPQLLELVSTISGIENKDITYFDDNTANIAYAKILGMNAILVENPEIIMSQLKEILHA